MTKASKGLKYATALALGTMVISGTNVFLTKTVVDSVKDPIVFTTLKNAIVAVFLIGIILAVRKWKEIRSLSRKQAVMLAIIGIIGGSVPFALFFTGLRMTDAVNGALIHKTLFLWILLLAIPILKERLTWPQWAGIGAIFAANLMIGGFSGFKYNTGELLILAATLLWAVENIVAKIVLKNLSSVTVASARMILGSVLLFAFMLASGKAGVMAAMSASQWGWTALTGVLLLGFVLTWYTALKHAPATYVATLIVPATLITNALSAIFVTHSLSGAKLASTLVYAGGIMLFIAFAKKSRKALVKKRPELTVT